MSLSALQRLGEQLDERAGKVCLSGVETIGDVCVIGSVPQLGSWVTGEPMALIGPDLYQACFTYQAGMLIPLNLEFKFKKDACQTWESVGNRTFAIDKSLDPETTLTFGWDDLGGECAPVSTQPSSPSKRTGQVPSPSQLPQCPSQAPIPRNRVASAIR